MQISLFLCWSPPVSRTLVWLSSPNTPQREGWAGQKLLCEEGRKLCRTLAEGWGLLTVLPGQPSEQPRWEGAWRGEIILYLSGSELMQRQVKFPTSSFMNDDLCYNPRIPPARQKNQRKSKSREKTKDFFLMIFVHLENSRHLRGERSSRSKKISL